MDPAHIWISKKVYPPTWLQDLMAPTMLFGKYEWKFICSHLVWMCGNQEDGYVFPKFADESEENNERATSKTMTIDPKNRKQYEWNAQTKNSILCGLADVEFKKVMQRTTSKKVWDKLRSIYEGDDKFKKAILQTLSTQFESLKMKEEEDNQRSLKGIFDILHCFIYL